MPGRSRNQAQQQNPPQEPQIHSDEDEIVDNLNINDLLASAQPQAGSSLDESRRKVKFVPENRSIEDIALDAAMAVDEDGNQFTGSEEIKAELSKSGRRLFVFNPDGELPYAFENRRGQLFCSDQEISSHNQLPGNFFNPAGSLDPERIIGGPTAKRIRKLNSDYNNAKIEFESKSQDLQRKKIDLKDQLAQIDKKKPSFNVIKPDEPTFSWGKRIQRWAFKFITLGMGETKAYRNYQSEMALYNELDNAYKEAENKFKADKEAYEAERKPVDDELKKVEKDIAKLRKPLDQADEIKERVVGEHLRSHKEGAKKIRNYRENTEVRMEGISDLIKEGQITKENIFANTWLKKAACEGKDPSDPNARKALEEYLASKMVEDKLLHQSMSGDLDSRTKAENESLLRSLNDGSAADQLRKDPAYKEAVEEAESLGEFIDPEDIYDEMTKSIISREKERKSPVGKLETVKKQLIDDFGKQPLSQDCIQKVMDMNKLNAAISHAKQDPKKYNEKVSHAVITDLYLAPGKQRVHFTKSMTEEQTRKTIQLLEGKQDGKTYSLDEMTKLINDTHRAEIEKASQKSQNNNIQVGP